MRPGLITVLAFVLFLTGCAAIQKDIKPIEPFHKVILFQALIHIVSSPDMIPCGDHGRVYGCAYPSGVLWVVGRRTSEGLIEAQPTIFGHEAQHILQFHRPDIFANPDK